MSLSVSCTNLNFLASFIFKFLNDYVNSILQKLLRITIKNPISWIFALQLNMLFCFVENENN